MNYKSQQNEDKILFTKYFSKIQLIEPIYFEAGVMDGIFYSNTYFVEKSLNWKGILVEPNPYNYNLLHKNRNNNNKFFNNIISNEKDELEFIYYNCHSLSAVSAVTNTLPKNNYITYFNNDDKWQNNLRDKYLKKEYIKPKSLTDIITESNFDHIDFFSLDVEGHELNVLLSFDWSIPINTILIENNQDTKQILELLISKNYSLIETIGCNNFFIYNPFIQKHNLKV